MVVFETLHFSFVCIYCAIPAPTFLKLGFLIWVDSAMYSLVFFFFNDKYSLEYVLHAYGVMWNSDMVLFSWSFLLHRQSEDSPSPKRQRLSHSVFDYTSASPAPSPPMRPWEMTSNRQPPSVRPNQHHFSGERCNTPARNRRRLVACCMSLLSFPGGFVSAYFECQHIFVDIFINISTCTCVYSCIKLLKVGLS